MALSLEVGRLCYARVSTADSAARSDVARSRTVVNRIANCSGRGGHVAADPRAQPSINAENDAALLETLFHVALGIAKRKIGHAFRIERHENELTDAGCSSGVDEIDVSGAVVPLVFLIRVDPEFEAMAKPVGIPRPRVVRERASETLF